MEAAKPPTLARQHRAQPTRRAKRAALFFVTITFMTLGAHFFGDFFRILFTCCADGGARAIIDSRFTLAAYSLDKFCCHYSAILVASMGCCSS